MDWKNRLYFGDNFDIQRRQVPDTSVDLIYADPPYTSDGIHSVLFKGIVTSGPIGLGTAIEFQLCALGWNFPDGRAMMES